MVLNGLPNKLKCEFLLFDIDILQRLLGISYPYLFILITISELLFLLYSPVNSTLNDWNVVLKTSFGFFKIYIKIINASAQTRLLFYLLPEWTKNITKYENRY